MPRYAIAAVTGVNADGIPTWISRGVFDLESEDDASALSHAQALIVSAGITGDYLQVIRVASVGDPMMARPTVAIAPVPAPAPPADQPTQEPQS